MKKFLFLILFSLISLGGHAADFPNMELFISLHKNNAKAEKESLRQLETSVVLVNQIKKGVEKVKNGRDILATRTKDITGNMVLWLRVAYIGKQLTDLTNTFVEYTKEIPRLTKENPMNLWYYTEALSSCKNEAKNLKNRLESLGAAQLDLMHATMDEKLMLINNIESSIRTCKTILDDAYLYAQFSMGNDITRIFIWDVLNSETTDKIAEQVINSYVSYI